MKSYEEICHSVIDLVRTTGEYVQQNRKIYSFDEIESKGERDFVTAIDKGCEALLVEGLKKILPEAGFIAEEGTEAPSNAAYNWIIDPIDGTTNFIHNTPVTAISVALADANELLVGVVLEITMNELFYTWQGGKSFKDGKEIHVSDVVQMRKALVATGFPYQREGRIDAILSSAGFFLEHCQDIRRFGSAATDLCYVACGRMEIYYEAYLQIWDAAAGILIVRNAGGIVSYVRKHTKYGDTALLATNDKLHVNSMEGVFFKDALANK